MSFEVMLLQENVESSLDVMYVIEFNFSNLCIRSAMANPRPLKLSNAALLQTLKNAILKQNRL